MKPGCRIHGTSSLLFEQIGVLAVDTVPFEGRMSPVRSPPHSGFRGCLNGGLLVCPPPGLAGERMLIGGKPMTKPEG